MKNTAPLHQPSEPKKPVSLEAMSALIRDDLKKVDALILDRVKNEIPLIHSVAQHIIASGGKRIRPTLMLLAAKLCGYTGERHYPLAASVEFMHTATLLHDDVVDESKLRRGLATANEVFGNKASVLVGDFLLGLAFRMMTDSGSIKVLEILSDAAAVISKGEVMQLMTEGQPETSIEEYLDVVKAKTAVLFAASCRIGAVVSDHAQETALQEFGTHIGIAFQLMDDILDYTANQDALGKTVGDDFREGKVTLPVIMAYAAGSAEEKAFWKRTLSELDQQEGDLAKALACINKHGAITQATAMAHRYCQKASAALANFPASPAKAAMLDIVDFCANRSY